MSPSHIVGIALVRDEDVFVERALRNVAGFCDELVLVDHRSRDRTPEILERFAAASPIPTSVHRVRNPAVSHDLIADYAGERVWVLGIDGDEIYDPRGLERFRARLLSGELDEWWFVKGIQLHCRRLDLGADLAEGWLAPPARSTTKLFNYSAVAGWTEPAPQRLHGGGPVLRPGYRREACPLRDEAPWEHAAFRCLHVPFFWRSSRQRRPLRLSIGEQRGGGARERIVRRVRQVAGLPAPPSWKLSRYTQGELVTVPVAGFFGPDDAAGREGVLEPPLEVTGALD